MKAIVCVKQVPDTSGKVAVNPDGTLNRASMQTITNPDDLNAVEAALRRAASIWVAMSATIHCRPWNLSRVLPNCTRSFMYWIALSRAPTS